MGFLDKLFGASKESSPIDIPSVTFDSDWQESMEALRIKYQGKSATISISVPDELIQELCTSIEFHKASERILYSEAKVPLNNVGETYVQEGLKRLCEGKPGEEVDWLAGFLMPEILNPFDATAVSVHATIVWPETGEMEVFKVGYMDKESAKKVHKKLLTLLGKDQYIPLLIRMTGGTKEKPNYGAFPYAMTDAIKFE
jgi:hypothetical protein